MNKPFVISIVSLVLFGAICLILFSFISRSSTTDSTPITTAESVADISQADTFDMNKKIGVLPHPGDSNQIVITGEVQYIGQEFLGIQTTNNLYSLALTDTPENLKVVTIDERLEGQAQLDRLYVQSLSEIQIGEKLSVNTHVNQNNELEVVSIQKNIDK